MVSNSSAIDVETCGSTRLPAEGTVVHDKTGCFVSVSVIGAASKGDVDAATQGAVLSRFPSTFFSCFEED